MPAGNFTIYSKNKDDLRINDLVGATVKLAIVKSTYTPNVATGGHSLWSEVSTEEVANGNGYTTGGITLGSLAAVETGSSDGYGFDSADPVWTASGTGIPAHRYYVMYVSGSLWGMTNPLVGYFVGDAAPADIPLTTAGNTLTVQAPAGGWFDAK